MNKARAVVRALAMARRRRQRRREVLLLIDNYDSFTYNLVQYLGELGAEVRVVRNDALTVDEVARARARGASSSRPGPCTPNEAGISLRRSSRRLAGKHPDPRRLPRAPGDRAGVRRQGRARAARHARQDLAHRPRRQRRSSPASPTPFEATRYHSLVVERRRCRRPRGHGADRARARSWGLRHKTLPVEGVQFHPESILTVDGKRLLRNFLER